MSPVLILALGYGLTWVGVIAYVLRLRRRELAIAESMGTGGGIAE